MTEKSNVGLKARLNIYPLRDTGLTRIFTVSGTAVTVGTPYNMPVCSYLLRNFATLTKNPNPLNFPRVPLLPDANLLHCFARIMSSSYFKEVLDVPQEFLQ